VTDFSCEQAVLKDITRFEIELFAGGKWEDLNTAWLFALPFSNLRGF
jgi:hypothetical protein